MSFSIPQRKKFTLEMTAADRPSERYIRARNQSSKEVDFGIPMENIRKFPMWLGCGVLSGKILSRRTNRARSMSSCSREGATAVQLLYSATLLGWHYNPSGRGVRCFLRAYALDSSRRPCEERVSGLRDTDCG